MRTYTIELRADFVDEDKHDILLEAVREAARTVLTTAMLLKDKREPQVAMQVGDMFHRDKEIALFNKDFDTSEGNPAGE